MKKVRITKGYGILVLALPALWALLLGGLVRAAQDYQAPRGFLAGLILSLSGACLLVAHSAIEEELAWRESHTNHPTHSEHYFLGFGLRVWGLLFMCSGSSVLGWGLVA